MKPAAPGASKPAAPGALKPAAPDRDRPRPLTPAQVARTLAYWQRRLRLEDWDVAATLGVRARDMRPYLQACIAYDPDQRRAHLRLMDPADDTSDDPESLCPPYDMEEAIVHELLHLHLGFIEPPDPDGPAYAALETAVNRIAQALIAEHRRPGEARAR